MCYFDGMMRQRRPEYPGIARALIANPGWYTMPDTSIYYPYGLDTTPLPEMKELLEEFVRLPKFLLLGGTFESWKCAVLLGCARKVVHCEFLGQAGH